MNDASVTEQIDHPYVSRVRDILEKSGATFEALGALRKQVSADLDKLERDIDAVKAAVKLVDNKVSEKMASEGGIKSVSIPGVGKFTQVVRRGYKLVDSGAFASFVANELDAARTKGLPLEGVFSWYGTKPSITALNQFLAAGESLPPGVVPSPSEYLKFTSF